MSTLPKPNPHPSRRRLRDGSVFWLDLWMAIGAVLLIGVCLNFLALRHPWRWVWHEDPALALSTMSQQWLRSIKDPIRVVVFHHPEEKDTPLSRIMGLLKEYREANRNIQVEVVDYLRERSKAQQIQTQYQIQEPLEEECLLFATGDRSRMVSVKELTDYGITQGEEDGTMVMKALGFKGEMLFTSTLMNLIDQRPSVVYFTQGHGEHDLNSEALDGYLSLRQSLEGRNLQVRSLLLHQEGTIPDDAAAVVIAGGNQPWSSEDLGLLQAYLARGGRVLVAFHFKSFGMLTGLEDWLRSWSLQVGQNVIDDVTKFSGSELLVGQLAPHPIMNPLLGTATPLVMPLPRSVTPMNRPLEDYDLEMQSLAFTTTNGVAKSEFSRGAFLHNPRVDARGRISLACAMEAIPSDQSGLEKIASRLIVLGDSQSWNNLHLSKGGNRDFASLSMNWLLERDTLMGGLGPRPIREFRMDIPEQTLKQLQWVLLLILPSGVFAVGFLIWLKRRY